MQGNQGFIWSLKVEKDQCLSLKAFRQEEFSLIGGVGGISLLFSSGHQLIG